MESCGNPERDLNGVLVGVLGNPGESGGVDGSLEGSAGESWLSSEGSPGRSPGSVLGKFWGCPNKLDVVVGVQVFGIIYCNSITTV